jgi:probable rRNA maturation factor
MMSASPRKRPARPPSIDIDIVRESPLWETEQDIDATLHRAIAEASTDFPPGEAELAIVLTDDSRMQVLNRDWRDFDKPTNVLSFPVSEGGLGQGAPALLGDIVIAFETTKREALAQGTPFLHHLAHLTVHGFLHLRGYDHEAEDEAETMEGLERQILARLDIPDPYAARDAG